MRTAGIAIGLVVASSALLSAAPARAADAIVDVGWWTRSPSQTAPDGGFAVAVAPDGPVTVAALRVTLDGLATASVEAVETGGLNQAGAFLQACPTADPWEPVEGGALDVAPEADCAAGSVALVRDAGARRWRADLGPLVEGDVLSVVIVAGEAPEGGLTAPVFDVRLAAPVVATTASAPSGDAGSGASTNGTTGSGATSGTSPTGGPSLTSPPMSAIGSPSAGFGSGDTSVIPTPATPSAAASPGSAPQPLAPVAGDEVALGTDAGTGQVEPSFTPLTSSAGEIEPRWGQALFFVVVSAVAAVTVAFGNRWRRLRGATA